MPAFVSDWTGPTQTALASSADQTLQYKEYFLLIHTQLKALGYTVERSSDGTAAADSDLIVDGTDVIWGTGTQAKSWVLYRPPGTKGKGVGSPGIGLMMLALNANTDTTTPNTVQFILGTGALAVSGSHTAIPSWSSQSTVSANIIPNNGAAASSFAVWTNSNLDLLIGFKLSGNTYFHSFVFIGDDRRDFPVGCSGNNSLLVWALGNTNGAPQGAGIVNGSNWAMLTDAGLICANPLASARCTGMTNWASGADQPSGRVPWSDIFVYNNSAVASVPRSMGHLHDLRNCPDNTPFNEVDNLDDGSNLPFELRCVGSGLAVPCDDEIWVSNP